MISPDTQTFVSTTTRRSNLGHRCRDVALDAGRGRLHAPGDASATVEQRVEALLPLVSRDLANAVVGEPVVNRLPHEGGDGFATALAHRAECSELLLIEVDVVGGAARVVSATRTPFRHEGGVAVMAHMRRDTANRVRIAAPPGAAPECSTTSGARFPIATAWRSRGTTARWPEETRV